MFTTALIKQDNTLKAENEGKRALYAEYVKNLPQGTRVEIFIDIIADDGTGPQIAKIHACAREMAKATGDTMDDVKDNLKRMTGLVVERKGMNPDILLMHHVKELNDYEVHRGKIDGKKNLLFSTPDKKFVEKVVRAYNYRANETFKSFADCSKEELSLVIQQIIDIGDFLGINFR